MWKQPLLLASLAACNMGPRVDDTQIDAPLGVDTPVETYLLPPTANVPSIATNLELVNQIKSNDGLADATLMTNMGVVVRGTGKAGGATVRFWNFGPTPVQDGFTVGALIYVFGKFEDTTFVPLANHPPLLDTICGDPRYSALRRVFNVPVTASYQGEKITSMLALAEALEKGLVEEPVTDATWMNMPVVPPDTRLELGGAAEPMAATKVYARGYQVDVFELGTSVFGRQPYRNNIIPIAQASGLQSGVASGTPPTLPVAVDAQLVFQFAPPMAAPGMTLNYSPVTNDVTVRLATGIAPSAISNDSDLFRRNAMTGAITSFVVGNVDNFTIQTTVNNLQLQFMEGMP
jgi:hypothetical protein